MGTRCYIAKKVGKNQYKSIYCHWDGGEWVNNILNTHYKDESKIDNLLDLGDISSLRQEVDIPEGVEHSFDNPHDSITIAYGRDRGEKNTEPQMRSKSELKDVSYHHIFKDGTWKMYSN